MKTRQKIIISCEHGGNQVPAEYQHLFRGKQTILQSHRGWDTGALALARKLAVSMQAPLFFSTTTRLLADLNRSLQHPHLFSEFTKHCAPEIKAGILEKYYYPYRCQLEKKISGIFGHGNTVTHLSIHSFTPRIGHLVRRADIGLLYDPRRQMERDWCHKLQHLLGSTADGLLVRRNYPYRGTADGCTTALRKKHAGGKYLGIEIEINQKHIVAGSAHWKKFIELIVNAIVLHPTVNYTG